MILLNGRPSAVKSGDTVSAALTELGVAPGARGIAVAVDGEVIPRSQWDEHALPADARVEVLTAIQGG
jgi:sulfur carrier protein